MKTFRMFIPLTIVIASVFLLTSFDESESFDITTLKDCFTDRSFSKLNKGITLDQINGLAESKEKQIALALFSNTYNASNFRIQKYEPYRPLEELRDYLGNQGYYSRFENPTGIRIKANEDIIIYAEGIGSENVRALIADHGTFNGSSRYKIKEEYYHELKDGKNIIKSSIDGNIYIDYYTSSYLTANKPTIHIASGKVSGYFDPSLKNHDNTFWKELLNMDEFSILDIKGKHVSMAYSRKILKEFCPNNGVELVAKHDKLTREEHDLMGLTKFNRIPKNNMFAGWDPYGKNPYASREGVYIPTNGLKKWASVWKTPIEVDAWGLYHELGHHNEMRGFRWQGTQEVVNNLYSAWCEYLNEVPEDARFEYKQLEDADDGLGKVVMGTYQLYLNQMVHNPEGNWNTFTDFTKNKNRKYTRAKVIFMWQLQLYCKLVLGKDGYENYFETLRKEPIPKSTAIKQLNYYKYFCDAVQMDLTEIFEQGKMLIPYSAKMKNEQVTITSKMVKDAKKYVASKHYTKPASSAIYYISRRTLDYYKNKVPIANSNVGQGVIIREDKATISNNIWKGAVAFEAYNGDTLTNCSIAYTGSLDNAKTLLAFPTSTTQIMAVAWDGTRKVIYNH